jgi:hypothetical protein
MDNNTKYFIALLSAFINEKAPALELDIDWNKVYKLARIHSVSGIIYLMVKKLYGKYKPNSEMLDKFKKDAFLTVIRSAEQEREIDILTNKLNDAKIPHVLFKGFVVKNYYPAKEMRTMGDIDILVMDEDRQKTHKLIQGLEFAVGITEGKVWDYTKNSVHLEIHTQIVYHNLSNGIDYVSYFSDVWNNVVLSSKGYTYQLTNEYHFLYLMVHVANHFDSSGCGIRMIMDIAMYLIYFEGRLDFNYLNKEIEKLHLTLFAKNVFTLCYIWFDLKFNVKPYIMEEWFYKDISQYILESGTFGNYQRNKYVGMIRKEYIGENGALSRLTLLRAYRKFCFPSYKDMNNTSHYPFLENRHFLVPIAWIYRLGRCTLKESKNPFRFLINIEKGKEKSKKQYDVFHKLGL